MSVIGRYDYTHEKSPFPNRRIQFSRIDRRSETIQAQLFILGRKNSVEERIAIIAGELIAVETISLQVQKQALLQGVVLNPMKPLSKLSPEEQDTLLQSLTHRKVEVLSVNTPDRVETVQGLNIFLLQ